MGEKMPENEILPRILNCEQGVYGLLLPIVRGNPVWAFKQDGLVDGVEVYPQANLTFSHLCDCRANYSESPDVRIKYCLL